MKNYELPCEVVQDLLPVYIDELTNEVTTQSVKSHLEKCPDCRKKYENMTGPEPEEAAATDTALKNARQKVLENKVEIDFLKKSRNRHIMSLFIGILATAAVIFGLISAKPYLAGSECSAEEVNYTVDVQDGTFSISGSLWNDTKGVSDISYAETGGILDITLKTTDASFFHKNDFSDSYSSAGNITEIRLNGDLIWEDGVQISQQLSKVYEKRMDYVQLISDAVDLAHCLGLDYAIGYFENEIQTTSEPYSWTIRPQNVIDTEDPYIEEQMKGYGTILIGLIGNLDQVNFEYQNVSGENRTLSINADDASSMAGQDIKTAVGSIGDLQKLLEKLKLYNNFTNGEQRYVDDNLSVRIFNESEDNIYSMALTICVNGKEICTTETNQTDGTAYVRGEEIDFAFTPEDAGEHIGENDLVSIIVTLYDKEKNILGQADYDFDLYEPSFYDGFAGYRVLQLIDNDGNSYTLR